MIFHSSFSEGILTEQLKLSPIFKFGNIEEVGNCRNQFFLFSPKVLERTMYNRTYQYFKENDMLFPKQYGSQVSKSTHHCNIKSD